MVELSALQRWWDNKAEIVKERDKMKQIVKESAKGSTKGSTKVSPKKSGLAALVGERVLLLCVNYFYLGTLVEVDGNCAVLKSPSIVYETGAWDDRNYKDAQPLCVDEWYVSTDSIESFGKSPK